MTVRMMNGCWSSPEWPCMPATVSSRKPMVIALAGLQHRVGHDQEQADIEGHQRADDVLGLRILAAGRGDGRGHLGIDHGDAGVEQPGDPAGDQAGDHAAFADGEVPAHVFADQHDADAERPDVAGAEHAQQLQALGVGRGGADAIVIIAAPSKLVPFGGQLELAFARRGRAARCRKWCRRVPGRRACSRRTATDSAQAAYSR